MLERCQPEQRYLFSGAKGLQIRISENTLNEAVRRLGYEGRLTGHSIRRRSSTALNELGYSAQGAGPCHTSDSRPSSAEYLDALFYPESSANRQ